MHESRPIPKTSYRLRALLVLAISALIAGLLAYTYYSVASDRYRLAGAAGVAIVFALAWLILLLMDRRPAEAGITGPMPDAIAAAKRWPIRYQLMGLVLVVAAPLAVLATMNLYANIRQSEESAYLTVRNVAQDLKLDTEQFLEDSKRRLELLAARPLVKAMDPNRCDPLIGEIRKLLPEYTNVALRDIDGKLVCGDLSQPGQWPVSAADFEWFREGKERADFTVGKAFVGKVTGRWISVLTYPVRDGQRQILGLLILPIDLDFLHRLASIFVLPPGSITALIDRDGTFIMHSTDPGRVGQNFRGKEITDIVLRSDRGEVKAVGTDAIKRIYSYDILPGAGWHVFVGIPSDIVMAPARAGAIEGAIIAAGLLVVIAGLGFLIGRSIEAPLRAIGGVASEIARGNVDARATLAGSREIAQVGGQFNAMLDAQHIAQQRLRRSEALLNETQALAKVGGWEYDVASDSIKWTDEVFRIYEISRDYDPSNVQQDIELYPARERVRLAGAFQRAVEQGEPYDLELQFVTANGRKVWVRTVGQAERKEGKVVRVFGNIIDITERKRAEETQASLAAIVENSNDAILGRALDGTVTSWNAAAERMLGYTETEVLGRDLVEIFPPELRQQIAEHRKLLRSGQSVPSHETVRIAKDGRRIDIAISLSAIKDHSGRITGTATMLRDITERKQTEQALHDYARRLQGLSRRMVAVGEIERRKINRELHDLIGQNLAALNINLNIIRSQLSQESLHAVSARLQKTQMLLEETAAHARNVMADLHPPALDDYGLLAALRTYVESFGARIVVPITVHGEDLAPRLSSAAEMALFRVAQGAIANAVQHARAKRIEVLLAATPERVTLTIADDGAGFDPEHVVPARTSWGLTIMQERAGAVGARLTVESTHGEGTRVCVEIDRLTGSKPAMNADEFR